MDTTMLLALFGIGVPVAGMLVLLIVRAVRSPVRGFGDSSSGGGDGGGGGDGS